MGIVVAFIFGCLVTVWWKSRPQKVVSSANKRIAKVRGATTEQKGEYIHASKVVKNPIIDDELKEILLEYAFSQLRKGKIKVVEEVD